MAELWYRGAMTNDGKIGNPPSERIVDLYERQAHNWDADRGRSLFEKPWLDREPELVKTQFFNQCGAAKPVLK